MTAVFALLGALSHAAMVVTADCNFKLYADTSCTERAFDWCVRGDNLSTLA